MIHSVWMEWNERPTKMVKETNMAHISMIPFPTITICLENKNLRRKFDISSKFSKSERNLKLFANLSHTE